MNQVSKYGRISVLLVFFLIICHAVNAQNNIIIPVKCPDLNNLRITGIDDEHIIIRHRGLVTDRDQALYDSIKLKVSKNKLTSKLYDFVVTSPPKAVPVEKDSRSEAVYSEFSGRKIRNIEINRLRVFGSNINDPDYYNPNSSQKFLNKTHANTIEYIIRNNLLFSPGDTLSPIQLSENEKLLRDLSFIEDARIKVIPLNGNEVDVVVITKDIYSLGGDFEPSGLKKGKVSLFENNIFGLGHELGIKVPFDSREPDSPGFGVYYTIDNIGKSFTNLKLFFNNDLGEDSYGIALNRNFISSETKYAGGIALQHIYRTKAIDTLKLTEPLRYNLQDYWLGRSFLLDPETVSRLFISARYTDNHVFQRPEIQPDSYHSLQRYRMFLGSVALSRQRYYRANLIYEYGRTEDIPYGILARVILGRELNEFKRRNYAASELSFAKLLPRMGYFYTSAGLGGYMNPETEQGIIYARMKYFTNLIPLAGSMIRNFVSVDYTRGFDRNTDEYLSYAEDNGFSGFRNDSIKGGQRITLNLETVFFSPFRIYGFRFAFFGFADFSSISGANQILAHGNSLSGIGLGIRVRNNNLVFRTFQLRIGFFPNPPEYSRINYVTLSGQQPARFNNFEAGPPSLIPYR